MAITFHLSQFDGPLDMLLFLIGKAKIDIRDIFVSEVTDQYIQSVQEANDLDMDDASAFITMAATLIEIKSRSLLPKPPVENDEEDPEQALIRQLEAYQKFKEASGELHELEAAAARIRRLDENADLPPKEDVDLHELALGIADDLKPAAGKNNIYIDVTGDSVHISGVRQLLYEMVYNLCDNAIKYNYPGGKVTMETLRDNRNVKLVVSDTGIGIPKEHQKRIFERFYRVDRSHSKEIGGTGLGLSIAQKIVEAHGWKIRLLPETNGTMFAIYGKIL